MNGSWIVPPAPLPLLDNGSWEFITVAGDQTVYAVGGQNSPEHPDFAYSMRPPGGDWTAPAVAAARTSGGGGDTYIIEVAVGVKNALHIVWLESYQIYWTMRDASGAWSEPQNIGGAVQFGGTRDVQGVFDSSGTGHVIWSDGGWGVYYACRPAAGDWTVPRLIRPISEGGEARMVVGDDGTVHLLRTDLQGQYGAVSYAHGSCEGAWSELEPAGTGGYRQLAVDRAGTVHMLSFFPGQKIQYSRMPKGGTWGPAETLEGVPCFTSPTLAVDNWGIAHVLWSGGITGWQPGTIQLYYTRRLTNGSWSTPVNVSGAAQWLNRENDTNVLAVEGNGHVHAGWLDGPGGIMDLYYAQNLPSQPSGEASLSQSVALQAAPAHPGLSFLYGLGGTTGGSGLKVTLDNGSSASTLFTRDVDASIWTHQWIDLQAWAGQTVQLTFTLNQAGNRWPAWAALDDVSVGSAHPNIWVNQSAVSKAQPGEQFALVVTYGNFGGLPAANSRVNLQLPDGINFISADPPPSATAPDLRWDRGDLPPYTGPRVIQLTLQVDPNATPGSRASLPVTIASDTRELELDNNIAQTGVMITHLVYLPMLRRY